MFPFYGSNAYVLTDEIVNEVQAWEDEWFAADNVSIDAVAKTAL